MTIPKSYEDLAADLASEKIISKTLQGQKEAYMKLADKGGLDLSESKAREDALREELAALLESYEAMRDRKNSIVYLQQRLTVAEQRETELIGLLKLSLLAVDDVAENCEDQADWATANSMHALSKRITAALKPAAEGEGS